MSLKREDELHRQIFNKERKISALETENLLLKKRLKEYVTKDTYEKLLKKTVHQEETITKLYNFVLEHGLDYNL